MSADSVREVGRLLVRHIMSNEPISVDSEATVREAAIAMDRADISCILVTSSGCKTVGIVTERDLVRKIVTKETKDNSTKVKDVMSSPMITVGPEATVEDAVKTMADNRVRRLPVVSAEGLVGIITVVDVARAWAKIAKMTKHKDPILDSLTRIAGPHTDTFVSAWRSASSGRKPQAKIGRIRQPA